MNGVAQGWIKRNVSGPLYPRAEVLPTGYPAEDLQPSTGLPPPPPPPPPAPPAADAVVNLATVELFGANARFGKYIGHGSRPAGSDGEGASGAGTVEALLHAKTDQAHGAGCRWCVPGPRPWSTSSSIRSKRRHSEWRWVSQDGRRAEQQRHHPRLRRLQRRGCGGAVPELQLHARPGETPPLSCVSTAFVAETPPLPCVFTAFVAEAPPSPCVSTAFVAKTPPLPCDLQGAHVNRAEDFTSFRVFLLGERTIVIRFR